jgi:hypothetical protein
MTERTTKAQMQAQINDLSLKLRTQIGRANFFKQENDRKDGIISRLKILLREHSIEFILEEETHQDRIRQSRSRFNELAQEYGLTNVMRNGDKFYVRNNKLLPWQLVE